MTVQELINELQLCNPDLPVVCEIDSMQGVGFPLGGVSFRSCDPSGYADVVKVGFGMDTPCVLLKMEPDEDSDPEQR